MTKDENISALVRAALEGNRDDVLRTCRVIVESDPDGSSLTQSIQRHLEDDQARVDALRSPGTRKAEVVGVIAVLWIIFVISGMLLLAIFDFP